jgi:predicted transcriptional regulator
MARRASETLTDGEARVMRVLWQKESASVAEVTDALSSAKRRVHYSTVQTMLRILEAKGYATHDKDGRRFSYRAVIGEQQARRRALRHLVARLFDNSPSELVLNVLEDRRIDRRELERVKQLIKDTE